MNWRVIKFKIGVKYLFDSIASKKVDFHKVNLEKQLELIRLNNFSIDINDQYYSIKKEEFKISLRANSSDISVFEEIYITGEYKKLLDVLLINQIKISSIIDLGSNIGLASYFLFEHYPDAFFVCVEPDRGNFQLLEQNTKDIKSKALYKNAIWGYETELDLNNNFRDGKDWSIKVEESTEKSLDRVKAITLQMIIEKHQITEIGLLKIDIEGSEFEIFKTYESSSFLKMVKVIVVEIHDEVGDRRIIIDQLLQYNFFLIPDNEVVIGINRNYLSVN